MAHSLNRILEKTNFNDIKALMIMPPRVRYLNDQAAVPSANNQTANYVSFKSANRRSDQSESVEEIVLITGKNKPPYQALTREQYFQLFKMEIEERQKNNWFTVAQKDAAYQLLGKLIKANSQNLKKPATFRPQHTGILQFITEDYTNVETNGRPRLDFREMFTDDETKGYPLVFNDPNFYGSGNPNDIKSILVKWSYTIRSPKDKLFGLNYEQEKIADTIYHGKPSRNFSDEPNSFMEGMLKKLDWKKLEELLTK